MPLSVWLSEPLAGCCPICETPIGAACAHRLPPGLAKQIVEAFTARGDLVYVPEAGNAACLTAAVQTGRKVLAYAPTHQAATLAYDTLHTHAVQVASLAVLRRGAPGNLPPAADRHSGQAQLAIAAPHAFATPAQLAALTESCAWALKPDGVLVITTRQSTGQDTAGHLVAHAQAAGLVYLQHIAAVEATVTDGHLAPAVPGRVQHRRDCVCHHSQSIPGRHALIHNDLLVLVKP
ncbi:hypothetical protein ABT095_18115 [Kitasatospora sp. NPDC002227]|uniref:hypothetical protein n=1 Tax=Kitasatospora sp. NPDC002227 TaxID=3154773 RepID=UPI003320F6F2